MDKKVNDKRAVSKASKGARALHKSSTPSLASHTTDPSERAQLHKADELLRRIEQKGKALSADADRLLRRVS
jgi:hypothetical protein